MRYISKLLIKDLYLTKFIPYFDLSMILKVKKTSIACKECWKQSFLVNFYFFDFMSCLENPETYYTAI